MPRDIATERDLMILRDMKLRASVADVLDGLRSSGPDDDEPWTEQRVLERHDFLRRSVRTTARLQFILTGRGCYSDHSQNKS